MTGSLLKKWSRRRLLRSCATVPLLGYVGRTHANSTYDGLDASTFRRRGELGDAPAIARAISSGRPVRLPAGRGSASDGAYLVDKLLLPSGCTLFGDGQGTLLRSSTAAVPSVLFIDSPTRLTSKQIVLRNMTIEGHVLDSGFIEHHNLLNVSGATDLLIDSITFRGFAGDAIYIGAEREGVVRQPRVNNRIAIRHCMFDGVNNDNRNAISITGGRDIVIANCRFMHCSRHDMPGPIDFESDPFPFYTFSDLEVSGCIFEHCGGNLAQIGVVIPREVEALPKNIEITHNTFLAYNGSGSDVSVIVNRPATAAMEKMNILIADNTGHNGRAGVRLYSGKGIIIRNNYWTNYIGQSFLGYGGVINGCSEVRISDHYMNCGTEDGAALGIYNADNVDIANCTFNNCGNDSPNSACILFGQGMSTGVRLSGNNFRENIHNVVPLRIDTSHIFADPFKVGPDNLLRNDQTLTH